MAISPFVSATTPDADGRLSVSDQWSQGRGAYGGISAAAMTRMMATVLGRPECDLRSLTVHCCAPLMPGDAQVTAEPIRVGSRVAHMRSMVHQNDQVIAHATASFGADRPVDLAWVEQTMPPVPAASDLPSIPISLAGGPKFGQFFDYRFIGEPAILSGADTARVQVWIRHLNSPTVDVPHAVGLLDAGPPGILSRLTSVRPMASVDFRMQLFTALPLTQASPEDHWLFDAHTRILGGGYAEQLMWMYTPDGQPIGTTQQLIAVLG
jgi:acyl-CoA thioesterase